MIESHYPTTEQLISGQRTRRNLVFGALIVTTAIIFVIIGDEKELWQARITRDGPGDRFDLDVSGVTMLRLAVYADGDLRGAHALWVDPVLSK